MPGIHGFPMALILLGQGSGTTMQIRIPDFTLALLAVFLFLVSGSESVEVRKSQVTCIFRRHLALQASVSFVLGFF